VAARLAHRDPRHRGAEFRGAASSPATANLRTTSSRPRASLRMARQYGSLGLAA
jgi:hypothetical protein